MIFKNRDFVLYSFNKRFIHNVYLTLALLLGSIGTSWGNDFLKGLNAYHSSDFATALSEWTPLAEQGHSPSQYNLRFMHYKGEGVPQDYEAAVKWYTRAAEQQHIDARFRLGVMYWSGIGGLQDYEAALKWYTRAAEQGDSNAQNNLGVMFANGQGVPEDFIYAHMWVNISALNGNANGRKSREIIEKRMIAAQIGIAEELAQKCAWNHIKIC